MKIETAVIRSEPHSEIGTLIEKNADAILERWCHRAMEEQPAAKRVHAAVLRDHFAKLLRAMGRGLKASEREETHEHRATALVHGEQRWENGWSPTEVVRDYQLMRLVVLEFLEQRLARPLYYREIMAVGVFIDDAIAASVATYVAGRDDDVLRRERERSETLQEANRRKDEFLAILGHELRNPLAPIQTSLRVIRSLLAATHPSVLTSLEVIERQSSHLNRLVDDILDLARIGQGRFELKKARLDLAKILEQAAQAAEPAMKARHHVFEIEVPDDPVELDADPNRLLQIIGNLLNNAAKYTDPGGRVQLSGAREADSVVIRVRDNGMGIPPEMRSRVFELFAQVEESKPYSQGGLGIGLTLVQRLVEQHDGTIVCASEGEGKGSEFTVRLPAIDDRAVALRVIERARAKEPPR
jgi:signal transduction histidine kinase